MSYDFFNIKLNEQKELKAALTRIFGFSLLKLKQINKAIGLNYRKVWNLQTLTVTQIATVKLYLPDLAIFDADLKKLISTEYDKFFELRNYKRFRFVLKLPARGQRTRSNAKTAKKNN